MAQNRLFKTVAALTNAAANILNGAVASLAGPVGVTLTQPRIILKHIRVVNRTNSAHTFTLYVGATGGSASGTEAFFGATKSVPANDSVEWFGTFEMDSTDFLSGLADANASLGINLEYEVGFS